MLFNSIDFLWFLPVVFSAYWLLKSNLRMQNLLIVVASYVFYGWWDWRFLILIAFTSAWSYIFGLFECGESRRGWAKVRLAISLVINLGILGVFKYYNFFADSLVAVFPALKNSFVTLNVVLPVGISFYTFQALSYTIDVYRGTIRPTKDPIAFFAFISFFPQLVAGPIERATNLLPQFLQRRKFNYALAVDGCRQMLWGAFKKVVMADACGFVVDRIFDHPDMYGAGALWVGAILFAFQIYGDFSGYSDIAIGCSRLFGFNLMRNFAFPYFSRDIAEFWRRWHISLTTWFRDYLYIPLGGSRCGMMSRIRNTFVVFLVSGLWHGANWTFVIWGVCHACLFLPLLIMGSNRKHLAPIESKAVFPSIRDAIGMCCTFVMVSLAWVLFRAKDLSSAGDYLLRMCSGTGQFPLSILLPLKWVAVVVVLEWFMRSEQHGLARLCRSKSLRWSVYIALTVAVIAAFKRNAAFIYFQF